MLHSGWSSSDFYDCLTPFGNQAYRNLSKDTFNLLGSSGAQKFREDRYRF